MFPFVIKRLLGELIRKYVKQPSNWSQSKIEIAEMTTFLFELFDLLHSVT